ncbi:MAG TPA: HAMP domain-containing histidine kinase, partial [Candidatus Wolfebacteria bacterium]|nr:HAMP domain-containing histidine kinase [Candidatus Wolfebacteria bacterium]
IVKAVDRLVDLVNNILNLGRIESGRMEYNFEEINFVDMVSEVVDELKLIADEKKLDLLFDVEVKETPKGTSAGSVPTGQVKIKADPQKLRQVIQNLIDNAIKYTPDGFVKVAITSEKDSVLFSVVDTGVGILPEFLPNLFQKFVRETAPGQRIQGTGLGLYIAKEIIKAHGGEIWAESEGRGFGSQFFVRLKKV